MTEQEQSLLNLYRQLSEQDAHGLVRYAQFLAGAATSQEQSSNIENSAGPVDSAMPVTPLKPAATSRAIPQPEVIARPDKERVVDALKRLSATYPMLEKKHLLDKASELVAQHVMFGKPAPQVIDEIEAIFNQAYQKFLAESQ